MAGETIDPRRDVLIIQRDNFDANKFSKSIDSSPLDDDCLKVYSIFLAVDLIGRRRYKFSPDEKTKLKP